MRDIIVQKLLLNKFFFLRELLLNNCIRYVMKTKDIQFYKPKNGIQKEKRTTSKPEFLF